jgi:nucleoside-diphosphate-sugar epimerase
MHVLILGGTGLISTAITRQLLERGARVTHANRGMSANPFGDEVTSVRARRDDAARLTDIASHDRFDAVIDMVCYRPGEARIAVEAFAGRTDRYVMCSTVDVFTKPAPSYPVDESGERKPSPAFPYAHQKAECERILEDAFQAGRLPLTILRPAATYADSAVPSVGSFDLALERLRQGRPLIMHGDGSSLWAACHRDDVARTFVAALDSDVALGRSYNVPGTELLTWNAYWTAVAAAVGVQPEFVHIPTDVLGACAPRLAEWCVQNFQYDNVFNADAAARDLGFKYTVRWADGIGRALPGRVDRPVDPRERSAYEAVLAGWTPMTDALRDELRPLDL